MKHFLILLSFLLPAPRIGAQDLVQRPEPSNNSTPVEHIPLTRETLTPLTNILKGRVWVGRDNYWYMEPLNSCNMCGEPTTFKHAAFDKKMMSIVLGDAALTTATIELRHSCMRTIKCYGLSSYFGSRPLLYGTQIPMIVAGWLTGAHYREGNMKYHIGGMRSWYVFPLLHYAAPITGLILMGTGH